MFRHGFAASLVVASAFWSLVANADEPDRGLARDESRFDVGVLGGVGFPRPFAVEAIGRFDRTWLVGAEYGFLPATTFGAVDVRMWSVAADARWFPVHGAFFLGVRGGYQAITGAATLSAANVGSYTESVELSQWFVNPRLGFLWTWKPFALGIDAGVQVPIATSVSRSSLLAFAAPDVDARITSATNVFGRSALPTLDLLKIGLVF